MIEVSMSGLIIIFLVAVIVGMLLGKPHYH